MAHFCSSNFSAIQLKSIRAKLICDRREANSKFGFILSFVLFCKNRKGVETELERGTKLGPWQSEKKWHALWSITLLFTTAHDAMKSEDSHHRFHSGSTSGKTSLMENKTVLE